MCRSEAHNCDSNAICTKTTNSFVCQCKERFTGDGFIGGCRPIGEWRSTEALESCESFTDCVCRSLHILLLPHGYASRKKIETALVFFLGADGQRMVKAFFSSFFSPELGTTCSLPVAPSNGFVMHGEGTLDYPPDSVITYACRSGYHLLGNYHRYCTTKGTWTSRAPTCHSKKKQRRV